MYYGWYGIFGIEVFVNVIVVIENVDYCVIVLSGLVVILIVFLSFFKIGDYFLMVDSIYDLVCSVCD